MTTKHPKYNARPEMLFYSLVTNITDRCNRNCENCCGLKKKSNTDMPFEKLKEVIKAVLIDGNVKVFYPTCVAEGTLYPHIVDMIKYIDSFKKKSLIVREDTNAGFIPDGFIDAINSVGYTFDLSCSLWAWDKKSYKELMGGDFDDTMNNIDIYLKKINHPISFGTPFINEEQFTKTSEVIKNIVEANGQKLVITENGGDYVLKDYHDRGFCTLYKRNYISTTELVTPEGKKDCIPYNNCDALYKILNIALNGDILPCMRFSQECRVNIGNINDYSPFTWESVREIYNSEKAMKYWHDNYTPNCFAFDECSTCISRVCY